MASFSQRKVTDYSVAFLRLTHGKDVIGPNELGKFLCTIGYCAESKQARGAANELIEKYDFSCEGKLCFEDFLHALEEVEQQVDEMRKYLEESLRYFCMRKLEQNSETPFGIDDIGNFLIRLEVDEAQSVLVDLEKDILSLFSGDSSGKSKSMQSKEGITALTNTQQSNNRGRLSIFTSSDPRRMRSGNNLSPNQGRNKRMNMALVSDNTITVPENSLIDIVLERICPPRKELILYETIQGHQSQQIYFHSLTAKQLGRFQKSKLRLSDEKRLEYDVVDPLFVISCGDAVTHTKPIRDYVWREESGETLCLDLLLPSLRSEDIAAWIDETEIMISVFDYNDGGVSPWTEWIGTARRRLSWFLAHARDGAPVYCSAELTSITPASKHQQPPIIEFSITIPQPLVQLWQAITEKKVHPKGNILIEAIRSSLQHSVEDHHSDALFGEDDHEDDTAFDMYGYWKKKRGKFFNRFPRRKFISLGKDEYGNFQLLSRFIRPFDSIGISDMNHIALTIAALDTGAFPHCDTSQSAYQFETIVSPSLNLFSQKATSLEAAIFLCSAFLGLKVESYVCFCEFEAPWVVTIHHQKQSPNVSEKKELPRTSMAAQVSALQAAEILGKGTNGGRRTFKVPKNDKPIFRRAREKEICIEDREKVSIRLWNPSSGTWYNEDDVLAPHRVTALFNHENVWFNVHRSDLISRSTWSTIAGPLADKKRWEPLLSATAQRGVGFPKPCYSLPDFTLFPSPASRHKELESNILLSDLIDAISLYRQHKLFLPDTMFDAHISRLLQAELNRMKTQIEVSDNLDEPDPASRSRTLEPGNTFGIPRSVLQDLPPSHIWNGSVYSFKTTIVQEIMSKLEEVGILNHTFPGVRYTVAAAVFPYPWGLSQVWVYIGTMHEIASSF